MSINSIPRIGSRIDPFADYVGRQVPVVVRGLFAGQPIARLCTRRDAQEAFGEVELSIVEEYSQRMRRAAVPRVSRMTLARYLTYVQQHPRTRRLCTEMPLPSEMRATFSPPEHVRVCGKTALSMNLFVANRGNVATLHYDGDYSHVLLYQVYGRKRVVLIEPYRAPELQPIGNISGISLQSMAGVAQRRLLGRLGASSSPW